MDRSTYQKVARGECRGWVRKDLLEFLPPRFFEDPVSAVRKIGGETIKESRLRWAGIFSLPGRKRIFLKRDRTKGWSESLKYLLLPSKGQKEWLMAYQLQKRNFNIPKPLGWMEKGHLGFVEESYYLSEAIGSGISFIEEPDSPKKKALIAELANATKKIHASGLFHKDFHAGNFLREGETFYLIDLHRAKVLRSLSLNQRLWNLSHLFHSLRSAWGEEDRLQFVERYFEDESLSAQKREGCLQKIDSWMDYLQKRQWQSRTKRCLKESTEFTVLREGGLTYFRRRDVSLDLIRKAIEEHHSLAETKSQVLLKNSPKVKVSIFTEGGDRICVKQFLYPRLRDRLKGYFRKSKGFKAWLAGNGLRARGIPSLKPLALMEKQNGWGLEESTFLMEASAADHELDRSILRGFRDFREKRLFIRTFAQWLSCIHGLGVYHKDMKTCNIVVSESGAKWDFHLLDLEDLSLNAKVDERKIFKNLLQLNASTPPMISRTDRLRFFHQYLACGSLKVNWKQLAREILHETRRRGIVFVAPWGVVRDPPGTHQ